MIEVFLLAAGLGLVFNAAPGAVFAESLRRGLAGGFRPAFAVQVGSLVGDAVWAMLGLAGVGALLPVLGTPLTVAGCVLLAWLGLRGLRDAARPPAAAAPKPGRAGYVGATMSLSNPLNLVYWSGMATVVGAGTNLVVFFAGFMTASLAWCFLCAAGIAVLHRTLPVGAVRVADAICGATLLGLAVISGLGVA
jgi:chemosensory pili system protein ChpE